MDQKIQAYLAKQEPETADRLLQIRKLVQELCPKATERICMGIPTFDLNGKWLVHYAGFKKHIGFYPDPETIQAFASELKEFKTSKGTVQFPLNRPLPLGLIREMTQYRIRQLDSQAHPENQD